MATRSSQIPTHVCGCVYVYQPGDVSIHILIYVRLRVSYKQPSRYVCMLTCVRVCVRRWRRHHQQRLPREGAAAHPNLTRKIWHRNKRRVFMCECVCLCVCENLNGEEFVTEYYIPSCLMRWRRRMELWKRGYKADGGGGGLSLMAGISIPVAGVGLGGRRGGG